MFNNGTSGTQVIIQQVRLPSLQIKIPLLFAHTFAVASWDLFFCNVGVYK